MAEQQQRTPVGIRFKEAGKIYYFDGASFDLDVGNYVVVETSHGREVGRVVIAPDQVIASEIKESLKPILRVAEQEDLERSAELKKRAQEQLVEARTKAIGRDLDMRMVAGQYSLEGDQLTFYFTAEERSDFRTFARDLSSDFAIKVQLLQVGDRDRAKLVGGIGRCGERLCCESWQTSYPTVSMKQAKDQDLPLNPSKLSGACGRLLCCLTFEHEQYREIKGGLPKVGAMISTPTGTAKVLRINVPKETISLAIIENSERVEMPLTQFRLMYGTAIRPKELTDTLDKKLFEQEAAANAAPAQPERQSRTTGQPAPGRAQRPSAPPAPGTPPDAASGRTEVPAQDGQSKPRRRRRRRGGRRQRRSGGS